MTETVSNAVATRGPAALIAQYSNDFATVLPSHIKAETWVRVAQGVLRRNEQLAKVAQRNPQSFMAALLDCARLGLEVGDTYHLVPFGSEIQGITDYTGEIELIYRAGAVSSVKAEVVYSGDQFHYTPDMERPEHTVDWFNPAGRGDMVGVYAYAVMKDGSTSRVVVMSRAEVEKVKAVSKTSKSADSPWNKWEDRMYLKTAVKQLSKWVPTSAEYRREQLRAAVEADNLRAPRTGVDAATGHAYDTTTGEIADAEIVEDDPLTGQGGEE